MLETGIAYQVHPANLLANIHCTSLYCDGVTVVGPKLMRILESTYWKLATHIQTLGLQET